MSTSAQVQAAWLTNIWNHASIQAITTQIVGYEATDLSETELAAQFEVPSDGISRINFVQYLVTRGQEFMVTKALLYHFKVQVNYYLSTDTTGTNWTTVRNFFDTVFDLLVNNSTMHPTWGGTVDYYTLQSGPTDIVKTQVLEESCWRGRFEYTGIQQITI